MWIPVRSYPPFPNGSSSNSWTSSGASRSSSARRLRLVSRTRSVPLGSDRSTWSRPPRGAGSVPPGLRRARHIVRVSLRRHSTRSAASSPGSRTNKATGRAARSETVPARGDARGRHWPTTGRRHPKQPVAVRFACGASSRRCRDGQETRFTGARCGAASSSARFLASSSDFGWVPLVGGGARTSS